MLLFGAGGAAGSRAYTSLVSTSEQKLRDAEREVVKKNGSLDFVDFKDTDIGGSNKLHSISIRGDKPEGNASPPLVIMPGYASGAGHFARVLPGLRSRVTQDPIAPRDVHVVDWLGTGLSSRPKFSVKTLDEAESFFTDSLEAWRVANRIDKMVLTGHSLGGYLSFSYAERYPERISHLVLSSPAGVPHQPKDWKERYDKRLGFTGRLMLNGLIRLWKSGATPADIVRWLGPLGPGFVERMVKARYPREHESSDLEALAAYQYHGNALEGSGEKALSHILRPFAYAHSPLCDRVKGLADKGIEMSFIYGTRDWMNPEHAVQVAKDNPNLDLPIEIVDNAGHQLHIDNPGGFLDALELIMQRREGLVPGAPDSDGEVGGVPVALAS